MSLATLERNIDDECAEVHAPNTTDKVEYVFANVDGGERLGSSPMASVGVAHAMALHAFASPGEKTYSARMMARKQVKQGYIEEGDADSSAAMLVKTCDMTSFKSIERAERWKILQSVSSNFHEFCVNDPRRRMAAHDEAALNRRQTARLQEIQRCKN